MKKRTKNFIFFIATLLVTLTGVAFAYLSESYAPTSEALSALSSSQEVQVDRHKNYIAFLANEASGEAGLIFYQGGKVQAEAYAPLMRKLAENGVSSYLVDMPFNLAVFDIQAANDIIQHESSIENWYLAGHSLGGAMASSYAEQNADQLEGLIFLAAYSANDLTETNLSTLFIYGTADEVMDQEKYAENRELVSNPQEIILEGGNHAQFGDYGEQEGDGKATMPASEQLDLTVEAIVSFIK